MSIGTFPCRYTAVLTAHQRFVPFLHGNFQTIESDTDIFLSLPIRQRKHAKSVLQLNVSVRFILSNENHGEIFAPLSKDIWSPLKAVIFYMVFIVLCLKI